jgi:hypothetical protein
LGWFMVWHVLWRGNLYMYIDACVYIYTYIGIMRGVGRGGDQYKVAGFFYL